MILIIIAVYTFYPYRMNYVSIQVKELPQPNPTTYVFAVPVSEVHERVYYGIRSGWRSRDKFFGSLGFVTIPWRGTTDTVGFFVETKDEASFGKRVFNDPANDNDLFLRRSGSSIASRTYFALDEPLPYETEFQIHLEPIGTDSTQVTVVSLNPAVLKGVGGLGPHGYYPAEIAVEPSTIEEYTILLYIGHVLGDTSMPELKLPGD
ncbi:MAG: hypothetical protein GY832_35020 [Chloroflexi bacterium]|nr:hypothetical protein [Chloroflexota bacterium]